jgi:hypothetical protein
MNVRSRSFTEAWGVADEKKIDFFSVEGKTVLYYGPWGFSDARYPHWRKHPARPAALDDPKQCWAAAGFALGRGRMFPEGSIQFEVPYWFWTLVTFLAGFFCARRLQGARQYLHRCARGLCPDCGYNLCGTPDRCPECGWRVKLRSVFMPSDEALARLGGGDSTLEIGTHLPDSDESTNSS